MISMVPTDSTATDGQKGESDGLHLPPSGWTQSSRNLFAYSSPHAMIRATTYRVPKGSYVVVGATEFCVTNNPPNGRGAPIAAGTGPVLSGRASFTRVGSDE